MLLRAVPPVALMLRVVLLLWSVVLLVSVVVVTAELLVALVLWRMVPWSQS